MMVMVLVWFMNNFFNLMFHWYMLNYCFGMIVRVMFHRNMNSNSNNKNKIERLVDSTITFNTKMLAFILRTIWYWSRSYKYCYKYEYHQRYWIYLKSRKNIIFHFWVQNHTSLIINWLNSFHSVMHLHFCNNQS